MLFLRIKQAEVALKDGRLDEAYGLAGSDSFRAHYRGQQLIGHLARALLERGQRHLTEGRLPDAGADCGKAERLAGNLPEAAALKSAIAQALTDQRHGACVQNDAVAAAREHLQAGELALAGEALAAARADSTRVGGLQQQLASRRMRADASLVRIEGAIAAGDWPMAAEALVELRRADPNHARLHELQSKIKTGMIERIAGAIQQGALDAAAVLLASAGRVDSGVELTELRSRLEQLRAAAGCVQAGDYREAAARLRVLAGLLPEVTWISEAIPRLERAAGEVEGVRGGPLGLLITAQRATGHQSVPVNHLPAAVPVAHRALAPEPANLNHTVRLNGADVLPRRFLLQVDGVGSYLVVRDRRITIGPVSSSRRPEVGLLAEASLPAITIERNDEDYILTADTPVRINGVALRQKLLANEDRIELSPRCRLRFTLPNAASPSAVVHISGPRLPGTDARRVILMDSSLVIGPAASAHIRAGQVSEPVVLYAQGDRLRCRRQTPAADRLEESGEIVLGAKVEIGHVSFVVTNV